RADRDRAWFVARLGKLPLEKSRCVWLGNQLRLKIQPRRHAHIGVRRASEAVDATMLASAIGIDGSVEGDVGRGVARDDRAWFFHLHLGLERRQLFKRVPAIVENVPADWLVAPRGID